MQLSESVYDPSVVAAPDESVRSAVSWPAVLAGAAIASASSVILIALGAAVGVLVAPAWFGAHSAITAFTTLTAAWFIVTQWVASAAGGYVTGRLRTKWVALHTHEIFFRDTANGFVTWAIATLISIFALGGISATLVSGGATTSDPAAENQYALDVLLRGAAPEMQGMAALSETRSEAQRLLAYGIEHDGVSVTDRSYLTNLVARRTGSSPAEAGKRVDAYIAQARLRSEQSRKAAAAFAVFTSLSLLIGAFIASVASALGGQARDSTLAADGVSAYRASDRLVK